MLSLILVSILQYGTTKESCSGVVDQGPNQQSVMCDADRFNDSLFDEHIEECKDNIIEHIQQVEVMEHNASVLETLQCIK